MLTIAICDDDAGCLSAYAGMLRAYLRQRPALSGQVETFAGGQALLEAARRRGGFDLYLLDIVMPGLDGIRTGAGLRALGGGEIIYLTVSNDYAADSYEVGAFFYLLKPVREEKLFQVLDRAVERCAQRSREGVVVATRSGAQHLLLDQILYVERVGRIMRYYCTGGTVDSLTLRVPFRSAAAPLLADRRFCLCGASFVINLQHVAGVEVRSAVLDSGERVELPRTAAAAFKAAWGKFWLGEP